MPQTSNYQLTGTKLLDSDLGAKINFIKYFFADINGLLRQVEVKFNPKKSRSIMPILFDGSSIPGFASIEKSDCWLVPDIETLAIDHLETTNDVIVAFVFTFIQTKIGTSHEHCPRSILKNGLDQFKKSHDFVFNFGFEAEFFLINRDTFYNEGKIKLIDHGSYFNYSESNESEKICREIGIILEKYQFILEKISHEVAPGQFEVNFRYNSALKSCDNMMLVKYICKKVAIKYGYIASFMPKPITGINGNGLHANISIEKNNKNIFSLNEDSRIWAINGILEHGQALAAFTNPTVNSYNRLTKGFEAPIFLSFSKSNRSTMIRIPLTDAPSTARIEVRSVDASCNIYLASYALIKSMMAGYLSKLEKFMETKIDLFSLSLEEVTKKELDFLPQSLTEALFYLDKNTIVKSWFSESFNVMYRQVKFQEWNEYKKYVSFWEQKHYINY